MLFVVIFFEGTDGFCSGSSDSCPSSLGSLSTPAFAESDPKTELRNELCQVPPLSGLGSPRQRCW